MCAHINNIHLVKYISTSNDIFSINLHRAGDLDAESFITKIKHLFWGDRRRKAKGLFRHNKLRL